MLLKSENFLSGNRVSNLKRQLEWNHLDIINALEAAEKKKKVPVPIKQQAARRKTGK
jgi:hypothetical protein